MAHMYGHPNCKPEDCEDCHDMGCLIHLGYRSEEESIVEDDDKSVPISKENQHKHMYDHPNCRPGDCENCHDMGCLIHLGYRSEEESIVDD